MGAVRIISAAKEPQDDGICQRTPRSRIPPPSGADSGSGKDFWKSNEFFSGPRNGLGHDGSPDAHAAFHPLYDHGAIYEVLRVLPA